MCGERHDPLLVLGRAIGFDWTTVRALVALRPVDIKLSSRAYDDARHNYERLLRPTAQRVLSFWRMRQPDKLLGQDTARAFGDDQRQGLALLRGLGGT